MIFFIIEDDSPAAVNQPPQVKHQISSASEPKKSKNEECIDLTLESDEDELPPPLIPPPPRAPNNADNNNFSNFNSLNLNRFDLRTFKQIQRLFYNVIDDYEVQNCDESCIIVD